MYKYDWSTSLAQAPCPTPLLLYILYITYYITCYIINFDN